MLIGKQDGQGNAVTLPPSATACPHRLTLSPVLDGIHTFLQGGRVALLTDAWYAAPSGLPATIYTPQYWQSWLFPARPTEGNVSRPSSSLV